MAHKGPPAKELEPIDTSQPRPVSETGDPVGFFPECDDAECVEPVSSPMFQASRQDKAVQSQRSSRDRIVCGDSPGNEKTSRVRAGDSKGSKKSR